MRRIYYDRDKELLASINKSTVYYDKKMFDKFMRNWCRRMHLDSWKLPLEDAGLAHGGLTVSFGGVGGGGLASQLA